MSAPGKAIPYDIDFVEEAVIKDHIKKFLLYPDFWNATDNKIPISLTWKFKKFTSGNLKRIPEVKGIYAFVVKPEYDNFFETVYLFYAGKTVRTLRKRFEEYLDEQAGKRKPRKKVFKMLNIYKGYLFFYYAKINRRKNVSKCEEVVLNTFVPHINVAIPKAKIKHELKYIYEQT